MAVDARNTEFQAALDLLDEQLAMEQAAMGLPGLAVAVVHDQDTVWTKGYGFADLQAQIPATPQTVYRVNSITKLFTATMLLQLRDAGKLHLDEPIAKYLPQFKIRSRWPDPSPPTFRQVVSHTAGLPSMPPMDEFNDPAVMLDGSVRGTFVFPTIDQVLESLRDAELVAPPMTAFHYSNLGFAILGHALERIAGQPYLEYVAEHILRPLEMAKSGFAVTTATTVPNRADAHMATAYVSIAPPVIGLSADMGAFAPAGQLSASAADIGRFLALQFAEGPARGAQILGGVTLREMHAPVFLDPDWQSGNAIGWLIKRLSEHTVLRHGGAGHDYIAVVAIVPRVKLGVALFTNAGALCIAPSSIDRLTMNMLELLLPGVRGGLDARQ